jgi:hypothetical protein
MTPKAPRMSLIAKRYLDLKVANASRNSTLCFALSQKRARKEKQNWENFWDHDSSSNATLWVAVWYAAMSRNRKQNWKTFEAKTPPIDLG